LPENCEGLPDRRGSGGVRRHVRDGGCARDLRHARGCRCGGSTRRGGRRPRRTRGVAVTGVRVVRSVCQLRGPGGGVRCLSARDQPLRFRTGGRLMVSRADRSPFAQWLWTVDRYLLAGFIVLMVGGVVLSFAASPAVAERLGIDTFHFVKRQAMFMLPALVVMLAASALSPRQVRRVALVVFILSLGLMVLTLFLGMEVKGARRWINIFGISIQPSEFLKPAFVGLVAFLLSESGRRREVPGALFSAFLFVMSVALLVAQPDFGQTMLLSLV